MKRIQGTGKVSIFDTVDAESELILLNCRVEEEGEEEEEEEEKGERRNEEGKKEEKKNT